MDGVGVGILTGDESGDDTWVVDVDAGAGL